MPTRPPAAARHSAHPGTLAPKSSRRVQGGRGVAAAARREVSSCDGGRAPRVEQGLANSLRLHSARASRRPRHCRSAGRRFGRHPSGRAFPKNSPRCCLADTRPGRRSPRSGRALFCEFPEHVASSALARFAIGMSPVFPRAGRGCREPSVGMRSLERAEAEPLVGQPLGRWDGHPEGLRQMAAVVRSLRRGARRGGARRAELVSASCPAQRFHPRPSSPPSERL